MGTSLDPREIYLLECYSSLDYFGEMRDTWAEMVKHVETCLQAFMQNLPPRYRSKPLPEQPDVVWGERVLPNFRETLDGLNKGFTLLAHGNMRGLHYANGPGNDRKGQMDYWAGWMSADDRATYNRLLEKAASMAHNIVVTEGAFWTPGTLIRLPKSLGELYLPSVLPSYRVNRQISVRTGDKTIHNGIYLPDLDHACAQFLSTYYDNAPKAIVVSGSEDVIDPTTGQKEGERPTFAELDCTWYLVERIDSANQATPDQDADLLRVMGGQPCPKSGIYFTPARPGSGRHFEKGELMPVLSNEYGATIWQWNRDQS